MFYILAKYLDTRLTTQHEQTLRAISYVVPHHTVPARFLLTLDGTARHDSYEPFS